MWALLLLCGTAAGTIHVRVDTDAVYRPGPGELVSEHVLVDADLCTLDVYVEDSYVDALPANTDLQTYVQDAVDFASGALARAPLRAQRAALKLARVVRTGTGPAGDTSDALEFYARVRASDADRACATVVFAQGDYTDGQTAGRAYVGEVCEPDHSIALVLYCCDPLLTRIVLAHEIGHIFGAVHETSLSSPCMTTTAIMHPIVSHARRYYEQCALNRIGATLATKPACLERVTDYDVLSLVEDPMSERDVRILMVVLYCATIAVAGVVHIPHYIRKKDPHSNLKYKIDPFSYRPLPSIYA